MTECVPACPRGFAAPANPTGPLPAQSTSAWTKTENQRIYYGKYGDFLWEFSMAFHGKINYQYGFNRFTLVNVYKKRWNITMETWENQLFLWPWLHLQTVSLPEGT